MPKNSEAKVQFTVLENGLDFIYNAITHLQGGPSPEELKYGVLHLCAGLELVLKDRLRREHWSLVFGNINKANLVDYKSGDFYSVDLKDCIQRLISICNVVIPEDDRKSLLNLKSKRNRLEHFATIDSAIAIKASSAKVLSFVIDFIANEFLLTEGEERESELLNQIRATLPEFDTFVVDRMKSIQAELEDTESPIVECPRCVQESLIFNNGAECKFCGYSADGNVAADDYAFSLFGMNWKYEADGGVIPIYRCPECWIESFVDVGTMKQDFSGCRLICFNCGYSLEWDEASFCIRCGSPFRGCADSMSTCADCRL